MARQRTGPPTCPCGSHRPYGACCGPFHRGEALPETAEELMRSRYSAFARGLADYLIRTTDRDGEAFEEDTAQWRKSLLRTAKSHDFPGVTILESGPDFVEFKAHIFHRGQDVSFSERSQFVRKEGRWLYSGGTLDE